MRTDISYHHGKERCSIYTSSIAGFIDSCCNRHIEWPLLVACHLSMYPTFVVYSRCCVPLQYWVGHICWLTSLSQLSHHKSIWSCPVLDDRFHWHIFAGWVSWGMGVSKLPIPRVGLPFFVYNVTNLPKYPCFLHEYQVHQPNKFNTQE
jgi:hypothetical protein